MQPIEGRFLMRTARSDLLAASRRAAMGRCNIAALVIFRIAIAAIALPAWSAPPGGAEAVGRSEELDVTPALIREMQFMLLRLGMEPGPIDGVAGPQTVGALHRFQERFGLPVAEPLNGGKVSPMLVARLRSEASRVIFEGEKRPEAAPSAAAPPARPAIEAPDRFADCPYSADDFRIGGTQYSPDSYLQEGFEGSTARAVKMLGDRLNEARQIAGNIGGAALTEVQRQSRVLGYFSCRLKIEQASVR
jgi:peptidoglycan hydrolase-like protein with peptidoglycan-binding domain